MQTIGQFVKQIRKKYGLTIRQMEAKCGLSNSYICQLENNKINHENVPIGTIKKFCRAFPLYEPDILLAYGIRGELIETQEEG